MNIQQVTKRMVMKGFFPYDLSTWETANEKIHKANMQVWRYGKRVMVIKSYSSQSHFLNWEEDQIPISFLYDVLSSYEKNNLYFLIILDWKVDFDTGLGRLLNRAEKDELVCRKYVLIAEEDLDRVPFLQEGEFQTSELMNYEKVFQEELLSQDESHHYKVTDIIYRYFDEDYFEFDKETRQQLIQKLIREGDKE